ncbi:MAG: tyrosine-type recombinase/integrase, partial [Christensenella sp.]
IERNLRLIKRTLDFAYGNGFMSEELAHIIPKVRAARNLYLPTIFTHEEINRLLNAVDRSNPLGKRDYAMLSIAAGLGLRVSDIVGLTFSEIDWKKRNLTIFQQKTSKIVSLPLPDEIGWAIIDYLQNGRPQSNSCRVFIKHCAPYDELSFQVMNKKLHSYLHMAEIKCQAGKHAGMHSFRHSLASSMLEHETPLHVITGALGQTLEHSTETYLSIDIPHLRLCALEVTE